MHHLGTRRRLTVCWISWVEKHLIYNPTLLATLRQEEVPANRTVTPRKTWIWILTSIKRPILMPQSAWQITAFPSSQGWTLLCRSIYSTNFGATSIRVYPLCTNQFFSLASKKHMETSAHRNFISQSSPWVFDAQIAGVQMSCSFVSLIGIQFCTKSSDWL